MSKSTPRSARTQWKPLGRILVDWYRVPQTVIDTLAKRKDDGYRIGEKLVRLGLLSEGELLRALAHQSGVAIVSVIEADEIPWSVRQLVPLALCARHSVCPVATTDDGGVVLAMADPTDFDAMADVRRASGVTVFPVIASAAAIARAIAAFAEDIAAAERRSRESGRGVYLFEPCTEDPTGITEVGGVIPLVPLSEATTLCTR